MLTTSLLSWTNQIKYPQFSQYEKYIFEAELFIRICNDLKILFKNQTIHSFPLTKINIKMEKEMLELDLAKNILNDILITEEYSLAGIAYYTYTSEDVLLEIIVGKNKNPSFHLVKKILELHRSVRPILYEKIIEKFIKENEDKKLS